MTTLSTTSAAWLRSIFADIAGGAAKRSAGEVAADTAVAVARQAAARFDELERRIAELESRPAALKYCGVHSPGSRYLRDESVTHRGGLWIVRAAETVTMPGTSDDWQLAVRAGRDGKDAR